MIDWLDSVLRRISNISDNQKWWKYILNKNYWKCIDAKQMIIKVFFLFRVDTVQKWDLTVFYLEFID